MHTVRPKTVIDHSHQLQLGLPPETPVGGAEVIVKLTAARDDGNVAPLTSLRAFFADLDARPQSRPRNLAAIEVQIAEERASWDSKSARS